MPLIRIELNGLQREIPEGSSIQELLSIEGAERQQVAVIVNERIIRPDGRAECILRQDDRVELLVFAGGG